jgi:hypothetical protein
MVMDKLNEKAAAFSGAALGGLMSLVSGLFFWGQGSMMGNYGNYGGRYYGMMGYYNQSFGGTGIILGILTGLLFGALIGCLAAVLYNWGLNYSSEKKH